MADVADSILNKKPDAAAADPKKVDFGTIFEQPKLTPKPAVENTGTAPKVTTGDNTGSAKPPVDAAVVPAKAATPDKPAATTDKPAATTDKPAAATDKPAAATDKPAAATDKPAATTDKPAAALDLTKPLPPELAKGLTLSKEVARILDNDVPQANRAHKLTDAEAAYNKAIEIAKQVTPEQIAAAKADYEAVLKAKATEKDPEKLRALAERQAADYTLMRVNDCAQGNKALWLYRQGRIEEGTTQFLQAAGLSPEDAKNLSKLTPEQKAVLGDKLNANATILTDENFMRQYTRIMESGQKLPQEFVQIHQYLRDQQEKAAVANAGKPTDAAAAKVEANSPAGVETQESRIATIKSLIPNEAANINTIVAGSDLLQKLKDQGAKSFTPEQEKALADTVKAVDDNLLLSKAKYEFSLTELGKLVPAEKAEAFNTAVGKIDAEFTNMVNSSPKGQDGKPALSQADAGLLQTITNLDVSAADRTAALAKLGETHPAFGKAVTDAMAVVGTPENGLNAISLRFGMTGLAKNYQEAIDAKATIHYSYADRLNAVGGKASDGSDNKAKAKAVLEGTFANLPDQAVQNLLANPELVKLATDTGAKLPVVAASADAAANPAKTTDAAAVPGQTTDAAVNPAAAGDMAAQLAAASPDQLLDAAHKMAKEGPDYIPQTKALYEELLKRIDDPARIADVKKQLADQVGALEKNQTIDGKPLDAATRLQYHAANAQLIDALSLGITVRQEYAAYLGGKDALAIDTKSPEKLQPVLGTGPNQMDLNRSMNDQLKLVYAAADSMPVDLMKREKANLEKSMATIGASDTQGLIPKALDFLQGTKERAGAIDISVTTRTAAAMMYISQGAVFNKEKNAWEHRSNPQIDSLYQPTMAVDLLKQADAKYKEIHGANATDPSLDQVKAFGAQLAPEQFKAVTTAANTKMWSTGLDIADTALSFGTQLGVAALLSKTKMGFAAKHAIADASSFGVNFATRSVGMRLGTGQWEAATETAVHAAAVTALVSTMKYGGIAGNKMLNRNLAGYESVAMAARSMDNTAGKVMTLGEYGERLAAKGLKTEADAIRNSKDVGRKIADMTDDELRAVLPTSLSNRGAEAMVLVEGGMTPELKAINELQRNGISTVGDIKAAVAKDLSSTQEFVQAAKQLPGYEKLTPRQAMEQLGAAGNPRFDTAKKITDELATLDNGMKVSRLGSIESVPLLPKIGPMSGKSVSVPTRDAKTIGEIESYVAKATPDSELARMFPGLKGQADDVALRQIEANGAGIFGDISRKGANGQGWRKLDELAPEVSDITKRTKAQWLKETLYTDRFYGGLSIPKTTRADLADVQALKAGMTRRADAVAVGSYMVGLHAYQSMTGGYDKLVKGVDENGQQKKYNFSEAMLEANFGSTNPTATEVLLRSGVLEGLFAGAAFRGFSKLGMAESRDLGVKAILGQNLNRRALTYQAFSSPLLAPFAGAAQDSWTLRPMITGADKPLEDYDYGLGTAIPAETPKAAADTTPKPVVDTTPKAPVDSTAKPPVVDTTPKPATNADGVSSPDASP